MPPQGSGLLSLKPKLSAVSPPQARAEVKEPLRVFADTGVLLAMILFPKDRRGHRTLAGEVLELEVEAAQPATADPTDAAIFAAAIPAEPKPDMMVSNDFTASHTDRAKRFFAEHGLQVESLYGLLCLFGLRERRADRDRD